MYFLTYEYKDDLGIGVLNSDMSKVVLLNDAESYYFNTKILPTNLIEFIIQKDEALSRATKICDKIQKNENNDFLIPINNVNVKAPIPRPYKNILCLGKNYRAHALEFEKTIVESEAVPKSPVIFSKALTSVIGPEENINSFPSITNELDYEVELGVVIGKKGIDIPLENVYEYIFGYTIINDVTARDLQRKHTQWHRGKSLDTFTPMGPYLVHKDYIDNPNDLAITCKINGDVRQNSNTENLIFGIPEIISTLSQGMTLEPGDIIATGTPAGVGIGFNPPKFLKSGDNIEMEITGLGVLKNKVN